MSFEYYPLSTLKGLFRSIRFKSEFGLPRSRTWNLLKDFKIKDWYFQVMDEWPHWPDSKKGNDWIIKNVPRSAKILDTACGIGTQLIRLEKHGFSTLFGGDINPEVIKAGRAINQITSSKIVLTQEDCLRPQREPTTYDVILFMSWIYHQKDFSLSEVLSTYLPIMSPNCKIVINLVDDCFQNDHNNGWNSNDWDKPETERRSSQYLLRHSHENVQRELSRLPFKILHFERFHKKVPKLLYVFERSQIQ